MTSTTDEPAAYRQRVVLGIGQSFARWAVRRERHAFGTRSWAVHRPDGRVQAWFSDDREARFAAHRWARTVAPIVVAANRIWTPEDTDDQMRDHIEDIR